VWTAGLVRVGGSQSADLAPGVRATLRLATAAAPGSMETGAPPSPPTFALTPRRIAMTFGPRYFDRAADPGPPRRGGAYDVKRRSP
jgi:hypothetical protein